MFKDLNPPKPITKPQDLPNWGRGKSPTLTAKAKHVTKAAGRIVKAIAKGDQIRVSTEELERRDSICNVCELWRPSGNLGMGECTHTKCGCTKIKLEFATETCPLRKW